MIKIGMDFGFGDSKIAINQDGKRTWFKETNAITKLGTKNSEAKYTGEEKNVVEFKDNYYLVGKSALQYNDASVMNIMDYESIKTISPIIAKKYLANKDYANFDLISFTLSSAFKKYSADYKEYMATELDIPMDKIRIIPQGAGCKIAIDKIGLDPDNPSLKSGYKNYLIFDIGFNTIDVSNVIDGFLMPEDIKGYEHEGVCLVAEEVVKQFKEVYDLDISVPRARSIIYDRLLKVREKVYDAEEIVEKAIDKYLDHLKMFMEKFYGERMDTIDNIVLFGGGAEVIRSHKAKWESLFGKGDFVVLPASNAEFFNALGACV